MAWVQQLACYNQWANARLYAAALAMPEELYRRVTGVFFRSLHGTLNHLLVTDRLWMSRLTGEGNVPTSLDAILYDDREKLAHARIDEDRRLIGLVNSYNAEDLKNSHAYQTTSGVAQEQPLSDILMHLFNHQTHHRGQAHACCSILTATEPPPLDLLLFQRGVPAPDLRNLVQSRAAQQ